MQQSREGSGCGGRNYHRHRHHLLRILHQRLHQRLHQPFPPPPPPKSRGLQLIRRPLLSRWCRQSYSSWGNGSVTQGGARRRYRRGRAVAIPEGAAAGVRGQRRTTTLGRAEALGKGAGDSVTRGGDGRRQGASAGLLLPGGGVTGGADRRHDDCCRGRRGKRRSHGRGRELASPEGRAPALPEEDRRVYWRGRRLAGPERVSADMTGGESAAVTGEARGGGIGGMGGGVAGGVERRHYRRGRLQAWPEEESANTTAFPSRNTCTLLIW